MVGSLKTNRKQNTNLLQLYTMKYSYWQRI